MRSLVAVIASFILSSSVAGCAEYAETVGCSSGLVLNDADECVAPPIPDGGVTVETCVELCVIVADWDTAQLTCLGTSLGIVGVPPASCLEVMDEATCGTCVADLGTPDATCATAGAVCQ